MTTIDTQNLNVFAKGDMALVKAGEKYFFEGKFTAVIACQSAFTIEQHEAIETAN